MKRTGFKKAPVSLKRSVFKKRAPKKRLGHDKAMLEACRGVHCYLAIPDVCLGDTQSVVPAHRNEGKGIGLKVPDEFTVPACYTCHTEYDQGKRFTREEKRELWNAAYKRWAAYRDRGNDGN